MQFINETGNTIKLNETGKIIPFLGKQPQEISSDEIKKSKTFQLLCIGKKFTIISATDDRMEQNLLRVQNGQLPIAEEKIEAVVRGHFLSNTGYGKSNRNLVYALGRAGVRVGISTNSIVNGQLNQVELEKITRFRRELPNAICIDSMIPSFSNKDNMDYRYHIINTTVEAATVPEQFVDACNMYDEVWVVSDFCKKVFEDHGVSKPIFVIPNSVDTKLYNENAKPHKFQPKLNDFIFVSVASWGFRKGLDALLNAYIQEFNENDNVTLLIITPYDGVNDQAEKYIKEMTMCKGSPHVARCGRELPEHEMPMLYKACNCFVLPSRGEGFGLPYVEASLCGLPIIATNHSGHTMFLNNENSYLVEIDKMSFINDGTTNIHYWDGQQFPELKSEKVISDIGKAMRFVYNNYEIAKKKNKILQNVLAKFSLENVGQQAAERLKTIWTSLS